MVIDLIRVLKLVSTQLVDACHVCCICVFGVCFIRVVLQSCV